MPAEDPSFPGRQRRERKDGSVVFYWVALPKAIAADFLPKTERLDYPEDSDAMSRRCIELQAQMDRWLADPKRQDRFDGKRVRTIRELIRLYQSDPESTYRALAYSTRQVYDWKLRQIDKTVGERVIVNLAGKDFRHWYNQWKRPDKNKKNDPEHVAKAHDIITLVRVLFSFGVQWRVSGAAEIRGMLADMEFQNAPARDEYLDYDMAVSIIAKGHEIGEHNVAFAQALQFDLMLRQADVIGKWEPSEQDPTILVPVPGLCWQHIGTDLILRYIPAKTEETTHQRVIFDLHEYPLVMAELARHPFMPKIGPMIVDPKTGSPYRYHIYVRRWREIADLAGIPAGIWNRDSRAGGVTEGSDAGASLQDLSQHAGHARIETTRRYDRKTLAKTKRVAALRKVHRNKP